MLINANQIDQASLALVIQRTASGASFSGNLVNYAQNSGFMGPTVLWVTGGAQDVTGSKRFRDPLLVNYSGGTGAAPSARWVNDQITASISSSSAAISALSGYVQNASGALTYVRVTGSSTIQAANFTGLGGTLVIYSGGQIFISGAAAGAGGGSNVLVTGSSAISSANFTGAGNVTLTYDGALITVSGTASAGGVPNTVTTTGAYVMAGSYVFSGSPFVPDPTQPSGAANLEWVSGVSGVLVTNTLNVSGVLYARMTGISGAIVAGSIVTNNYFITGTGVVAASSTGNVTNTFNITSGSAVVSSSGTVSNTFNGTVNSVTNLSGITGNFVTMSFYYDENNLSTGLNTIESFVSRDFTFTGYAAGVITTGTQGAFSGSFYQRTPTNAKTTFINFGLPAGQFCTGRGGFAQVISGMNRVGLDIYTIGTGITGLSVGLFGVGY